MASGESPRSSEPGECGSHELGDDDLKVLSQALYPVAKKYMLFGIQINVRMDEIEKIEKKCADSNECLAKILSTRLKQDPPLTWKDIYTALRAGPVGEGKLANDIKKKYGHLFSPDPGRIPGEGKGKSKAVNKGKSQGDDRPAHRSQGDEREQHSDEEVSPARRRKKESEKSLAFGSDKPHSKSKSKGSFSVHDIGKARQRNRKLREKEISESETASDSDGQLVEVDESVSQKYYRKSKEESVKGKRTKSSNEEDVSITAEDTSSSDQEQRLDTECMETERYKRMPQKKWGSEYPSLATKGEVNFSKENQKKKVTREKPVKSEYSQSCALEHHKVRENIKKSKKVSEQRAQRECYASSSKEKLVSASRPGKSKSKRHSESAKGSERELRKPKLVQTESESEDDSSSACTSKEQRSKKSKKISEQRAQSESASRSKHSLKPGKSKTKHHSQSAKEVKKRVEGSEKKLRKSKQVRTESESENDSSSACTSNEQLSDEDVKKESKVSEQRVQTESYASSSKHSLEPGKSKAEHHPEELAKEVKASSKHSGKSKAKPHSESAKEVRERIQGSEKKLRETKRVQTESESKDRFSSAYTSEEQLSDKDASREPAGMRTPKEKMKQLSSQYQSTGDTKKTKVEKGKDSSTKKATQKSKKRGDEVSLELGVGTKEQHLGSVVKRAPKVSEKTGRPKHSAYERYPETHSRRRETKRQGEKRREREVLSDSRLEPDTPHSDSSQGDSEDEESNSDDRSEHEQDRDLEQKSSNEEEEIEPDDESSPATSEVEVRQKSEKSAKHMPTKSEDEMLKDEAKAIGRSRLKRVKIVTGAPDVPGDGDQSDAGGGGRDLKERGIQPKKKGRKKHREASMSPIARGSSSPSTSQEESQKHSGSRRQRGKAKKQEKSSTKRRKEKERETRKASSESSDSSSSSPECDQETEGKKLGKVFKNFFGRLCFAIKNPVEIATLLQIKGLVRRSVMNELLISPESNQEKAITLVGALEKKMKPSPERIFTVIEVFLNTEALQETGKEMLTETRKVCPKRAAILLDSEQPPPEIQPTLESIGGSESATMLTSAMETNSPQAMTQTAGSGSAKMLTAPTETNSPQAKSQTSGTLSFLEVSQPVSVLAKYKQYLQSCYNARALAPADKYLPTLKAPYINLAMIRREVYDFDQRDEFTKMTLHGGVDQILESKVPMNIVDLLMPEMEDAVRFVLVEGPPGIGKSTFAWEVCRRWDEIESLRDYHTVVLLKLREKWVLNAIKPSDLFRFPPDPEFSRAIAKELNESYGHNLLFILDGFDEVSHSFHENSVIKSIMCRQLLPKCTIILTTRPVAKYTLMRICQPRVDKHIEIVGFAEEERVGYITEVFSKEPDIQANFLKYMFHVPHIKSMMYIPLNCAIIAQVYYESQCSCHLTIPKTRTQLYKALTHSLLVRHMQMKGSDYEYTCMLPEGLNEEDMKKFESLAKFAFVSYHKGWEQKVTFFKEDIPEGLIHFGFMNESTEMYAGKGVERIFSFLHLSLQEYLAAWHIANNYSIEFQVAYHRKTVKGEVMYKGHNKEEVDLLYQLRYTPYFKEPALFLAGITGWNQSEHGMNHWETCLSYDTFDRFALVKCLYEAQNPALMPRYFKADPHRRTISIDTNSKPYDCYCLAYCAAFSDQFNLYLHNKRDFPNIAAPVEIFVKGFNDHSKSTVPKVKNLIIYSLASAVPVINGCLLLLMKTNILNEIKEFEFDSSVANSPVACKFMKSLYSLQSLDITVDSSISWEWLTGLKSLSEFKVLHISGDKVCSLPPTDILCWLIEHRLTEAVLDIKLPSKKIHDLYTPTDALVDSVLKSKNQITKLVLPNISRHTMAGVHSILLHCPSLATLELKNTKLGYDGILYICSALRKNTNLKYFVTYDDLQLPPSRQGRIDSLSSMQIVPLPDKTTSTDFLLELNNILKDNTTLEMIKIQSGLFLPLTTGNRYRECCQWTGLEPFEQFNVGAVSSGMSPNLRRSFSSSDLTQPQTTLFWDKQLPLLNNPSSQVDFKQLFLKKRNKLSSLPSFTAPDIDVLQSFSGLDYRLKECLGITHLDRYIERLRWTYWGLLWKRKVNLEGKW